MNLFDLFIIYLACGAPFGVYYFLRNRPENDLRRWLKSLLVFLFWIPFALQLLYRKINSKNRAADFVKTAASDVEVKKEIDRLEKSLERVLLETSLKISVYEFREIVERYIGLTAAKNAGGEEISEHEKEIFRITSGENAALGSVCLRRRNRKRLFIHQTAAREDFLKLISQISKSGADQTALQNLATALIELVKDFETRDRLEKMFAAAPQTGERAAVKKLEQDLWKPETRKPQTVQPISRRPIMRVTVNLRKKD